ncbi:hypothetical protein M405DRAFT_811111 [Rhizopogon salebrosus TDB-379]|nr:hypothetical protein M405DRAFT_811111 [Rhizopogon salebrosus TDB-379]
MTNRPSMARVAMYSSTVVAMHDEQQRDPRTSMFTPFLLVELRANLEPSSTVKSLWELRTLPSIIAYSSKPMDNRGGTTLLEGTRESSRQVVLCLRSIPAMYIHTLSSTSHKKCQSLNSAYMFFEYPSPLSPLSSLMTIHPPHPMRDSRVERHISADCSIGRDGL